MDDGWVCGSCRSINRPGSGSCYSCREARPAVEDASVAGTGSGGAVRRIAGLGMTTICPACGTPRLGWSSVCRSCGLSFDEIALGEVAEAASRGPGSLGRLLVRRLPVLVPGLLLLVVCLAAIAFLPSIRSPGGANVPPVGQVWFGSSYSNETFELADRRTSIRVGDTIALVAHLSEHVGPGQAQVAAFRDGVIVASETVNSIGGSGDLLAGRLTPLQLPGTYRLTITNAAGHELATGTFTANP
jgi:hypothetical protein